MPKNMFDSAAAPSAAIVKSAVREGVSVWGVYVAGSGADHIWTLPEVNVLRDNGIQLCVPICAPAFDETTPTDWVDESVRACQVLGISTEALALDPELLQASPGYDKSIDGWNDECRSAEADPIVYGKSYFGSAYQWVVNWGNNTGDSIPGVANDEAIQYQGDAIFEGFLVDKSVVGDEFPTSSTRAAITSFVLHFPILKIKSRGAYVEHVQQLLAIRGCPTGNDGDHGIVGEETVTAWQRFQTHFLGEGKEVDWFGEDSLDALLFTSGEVPTDA